MKQRTPERVAYEKDWRNKNKERVAARQKKYRLEKAETLRAKKKAYYEANKKNINIRRSEQRKLNPEKFNNALSRAKSSEKARKRNSGFTAEIYQITLHIQKNRCAICQVSFEKMPPHRIHADHCHTTKRPRGILCGNCNQALGLMKDSIERLLAAANYLSHFPLELI